ncbi:MAG TPA: valine--tRNA ligase, partial [Candidatus Omnitrophota bacterium]|nr:valine--tRNA ligase [Candidatus Omnitrophota bacterium]
MQDKLKLMAQIEDLNFSAETPSAKDSASGVVGPLKFFVPLSGIIDIDQEKSRMRKEQDELDRLCQTITKRLSNEQFLAKAPQDVVDKEKAKVEQLTEKMN